MLIQISKYLGTQLIFINFEDFFATKDFLHTKDHIKQYWRRGGVLKNNHEDFETNLKIFRCSFHFIYISKNTGGDPRGIEVNSYHIFSYADFDSL